MNLATLINATKKEINENIFLSEIEKRSLIKRLSALPEAVIRYFYKILKRSNKQTQTYIKKAIDIKPEIVLEIKTKSQKIIIKMKELRSNEKNENPEEMLESQLNKLK